MILDFAEMLADPISHLPPAEREQKERRERLRALQTLSSPDEVPDDAKKSPDHDVVDGKTTETETFPETAPLVTSDTVKMWFYILRGITFQRRFKLPSSTMTWFLSSHGLLNSDLALLYLSIAKRVVLSCSCTR